MTEKKRHFAVAIGNNMKAARLKALLTQSELGERAGLSQNLVGMYERGECEASLEKVYRLAHALRITLDEYIGLRKKEDQK